MPIIFEDALKKDAASGNFADGYIIYGDDAYLKKHYTDLIADKTAGLDSAFDLQKFSGECDLQEVYNALLQYPLMSERKCVILTDFDFEKAGKNDFDRLADIIGEINETGVFILRFDSIPFDDRRSSKAKKLIAAMEKHGGKAVRLDHRRPAQLIKMLCDGAAKRKCRMESTTAKYLIECVGNDINILKNELDKLCHYAAGGAIEKSTVDNICVKTVESSVYDLNSRIFACDISGALKLLDNLFFMHIEPMVILYTVSGAYTDMFRAAAAKKCGASLKDVAAVFGYRGREFVLDRAAANLKKFDAARLDLSLQALIDADRAFKTAGADGRTVLDELIVKLCFIMAKGQTV